MDRGAVGRGAACPGDVSRGQVSPGEVLYQNHSLGQRACGCERRGVAWILSRFGAASWVQPGQCWVMFTKPPSCGHGGRSTRPWWDQLRPFWAVLVSSGHGASVPVAFAQGSSMQARARQFAEPLPCQARAPINAEGAGCLWLSHVLLGHVCVPLGHALASQGWFSTTPVQARGWINASGVGWIVLWLAMSWSCRAMWVGVRWCKARLLKPPRGRRGSGFDA